MPKVPTHTKGRKDMVIEIDDDEFIIRKPSAKPQTKAKVKVPTKPSPSTNMNDKALPTTTCKRSIRSSAKKGTEIQKTPAKNSR